MLAASDHWDHSVESLSSQAAPFVCPMLLALALCPWSQLCSHVAVTVQLPGWASGREREEEEGPAAWAGPPALRKSPEASLPKAHSCLIGIFPVELAEKQR